LSDLDYRQRAYIIVVKGYIGHFPVFLKLAKEVAEGRAASEDLTAYAHNLQAMRAFEDWLKLSAAENMDHLESPERPPARTDACKLEWDQGIDATL